ncbi:MAG: hypothetical protein ABIN67_02145, partial [Ferruginibacter sp.]
ITNEIRYKGEFTININRNNSISFSMKGTALSGFKKNRIGLCVLHPLACKGKRVKITKPTDDVYESIFPKLISPHQPFKNIHQMEWEVAEGLLAHLAFHGEIFETEDQRNWSDSSYKTYSTPLELPFPAWVSARETLQHQVVLTITGNTKQKTGKREMVRKLTGNSPLPKIGYCRPTNQLTREQLLKLSNLTDHWRVELRLFETSWRTLLLTAAEEASILKTKLELIVFFSNDYDDQLHEFLQQLSQVSQHISSILLLSISQKVTPADLMRKGFGVIKIAYPFIKVGYGTDGFFAELNRNRPGDLPCDFVSFSLTPTAHAGDTRTIIENLDSQREIIQTIRSFTDKEIHVSPLTINQRTDANMDGVLLPDDQIDYSQFGKAWISFAVHQLSEAESITILLSDKNLE